MVVTTCATPPGRCSHSSSCPVNNQRMRSSPVIVVAGLARSGASLVMQMLDAGGVRCAGEAPTYEVRGTEVWVERAWLTGLDADAVKVVDPHRVNLPRDTPIVAIWVDRDPLQLVLSQAKFMRLAARLPAMGNAQLAELHQSVIAGRAAAMAHMRETRSAAPLLVLPFEHLIESPSTVASSIADHIRPWCPADADLMAGAVLPRQPGCAPDLSIEFRLVARMLEQGAPEDARSVSADSM